MYMTKTIAALLTAVCALCVVTACSHKEDHGHNHQDMLQITGYSDTYEVFAEATPMAAGEETEILAHFTNLSDFKPLGHATVTASLAVGKEGVRQTASEPVRPGVYRFELTPETAGSAKLIFDIDRDGQKSRIVVDGLQVYADHEEAWHEAAEAVAKSSNGVAFTKAMSWKTDFATEPAERRPMGQVIRTMARVQPSAGDVRTLTAKSAGTVIFADPHLTDGKAVAAGQTLFRIDASALADNNLRLRLKEAESNYDRARQEYERHQLLVKEHLATQSELLTAKNEYENARAAYESLRAGFAGGASSVTSPLSGYLTQLAVTNGQYVEAGQTLATVAQNRDLFLQADVQQNHYPLLGRINNANLRPMSGQTVYPLSELGGSVVSYGKSVEASSPLVPVVFRVNNSLGLLPGSFVEMYINAGDLTPVLAVPTGALVEEMGNYFVYVQLTPEYFEKREVTTGRTDGLYTEITSGLDEGDRIVSRGAVLVKLAQATGTLDPHAGHVH